MKLIERNDYLTKLINVMGTPDIKVLTGVRRSGKSKLLELFKEYIKNNVNDYNIIHINFNLKEFDSLKNKDDLYNYVTERYIQGKKNFVMIDEVKGNLLYSELVNAIEKITDELIRKIDEVDGNE